MGALVGLAFGLGCYLIWTSLSGPRRPPARPRLKRTDKLAEQIAQAGLEAVTPGRLLASAAGLALVALLLMLAISRSPTIALAFGLISGYLPVALVRYRRRQRQVELREFWPEVVDNVASAIRAGMSLPESLAHVSVR